MHPFIPYAQTEACEDRILASWPSVIRLPITYHVRTLRTWVEAISGTPLLLIFSRANSNTQRKTVSNRYNPTHNLSMRQRNPLKDVCAHGNLHNTTVRSPFAFQRNLDASTSENIGNSDALVLCKVPLASSLLPTRPLFFRQMLEMSSLFSASAMLSCQEPSNNQSPEVMPI